LSSKKMAKSSVNDDLKRKRKS